MSQRYGKPGRRSLVGSVVLHVAAVAAFWIMAAFRPEPVLYETYAIDLYSPPPTEEAAEPDLAPPAEELVVETPVEEPEPTPPPPVPDPDPDPVPEPPRENRPAAPPPTPTPPIQEPDERRPSRGPDADATSPGGVDINIQLEGLKRDFPEYYGNIALQIERCFRPPREGSWQTKIDFVINRDGSVSSETFSQRSGNLPFDYLAMSAIECAGGRFGAFPEGLRLDRLPIRFTFEPRP
jgi:protein TonB